MANYDFLVEALDPARLKAVAKKGVAGTGGPAIPLPDGTSVTRDVIASALEGVLAAGTANCGRLVQALSDQRVHIRYGALFALRRITGVTEADFYPFQAPDSPRNIEAIGRWKERCDRFSSDTR